MTNLEKLKQELRLIDSFTDDELSLFLEENDIDAESTYIENNYVNILKVALDIFYKLSLVLDLEYRIRYIESKIKQLEKPKNQNTGATFVNMFKF